MKHKLQTLLKHKLQWLLLLIALLGVSQTVWGWSIAGSFNSWNKCAYVSVGGYIDFSLAANTSYTFKIWNGNCSNGEAGTWYGNNGTISSSTGDSGWQFYTGSGDCTLKTSGAGTYRIKLVSNAPSVQVIFPASCTTPTASNFTIGTSEYTYDGSSKSVSVTAKYGSPTVTVYYTGINGTSYTKSTTAPSAVGRYKVTVNTTAVSSYCAVSDLEVATLKIKKTVTVRVKKEGDYASTTPYLYSWYGTDETKGSGDWPGSAMTLDGTSYKYQITIDAPTYNIIVSKNGSDKTSDIKGLTGDVCYSITSKTATAATATKPTVTTTAAASITTNTATLGGNVTDAGQTSSCGAQTVTARGIEWVSGTGKTAGAKEAASASGTGSFTVNVTGLTAGTTYTYKAYATNATGTSYGSNKSFTTTSSCTTVTSTSAGGSATLTLSNGAAEAITSSTTYNGSRTPEGSGDTYLWTVSPSPFTGATTIGTSTATSTTIRFRREGQYAVKFAAGCGSASVESSAYTVNVYPGNLYVAGPLVNNSWTVTPASQTMTKTGSGTSSVYTYEWTAPSDFVAGSSSVEGGEFTVQSVTNMSLPNYILPAYCPADPSTYTNIYRVTNTTNHNLRCTFAVSSGDKLKLRVAYNGTTGTPKAPYYTFTLNKVPVPTTDEPDNITWTQAKLWGTYPKTSEYASISTSESGFYYGTTSSPATKVYNGSQTAGRLAKTIKNLTPGTTYYYKAFVVSGGVEYCGAVESFTTTACSNPTISTQPSTTAKEYCKDDASPATLTVVGTGGVGEYTYQWKQCATSGGTYTNVSAGSGGTTATYTPSTATAGELYYKCVVTNSEICTSYSVLSNASGKYTIDATSVGGSISGGSTSVCPGTTKNLKLGSYTGSIQWHSSSESGFTPSSTTAISGATSATYAAPISTAGTKYYKAVVKNGVCAAATSSQSYLTVKRSAVAGDYTLTNNAQTYDGTARAVTVTPASGAGAATVYYTGTGSTTYAKSTTAPTNAGSYSISIDAANGDDYCAATNLSLGSDTIKKATQETLTISNTATDLVYCNAANVKLTTSGGSGDGAVTYTVTSGSGSVDGDVLSPSAKGSVSVVADKAASTNYRGIKSEPKTFNFNKTAPTVYTLSNVGGATTICGDPSSGAGSGTLRLANSQTGYKYQLYSNGAPIEGYAAKAGTTGSSIDFPVTSSGTYTVYAYYGDNSTNCPTLMDGEITLTISTQPRLVRSAASVTQYMPVTITSVSTDIAEWKITDNTGTPDLSSSTAYLYDKTYDAISFKGASTNGSTAKTYTIQATTAGGCSEKTTITVNPDTEACSN